MKLKLVSPDGLWYNTKIINKETGEELEGITSINIDIEVCKPITATITMVGIDCECEFDSENTLIKTYNKEASVDCTE